MEVRISRASAVVVQRVPPTAVEWFLEWQRGVTDVVKSFAGYQSTDVYPPNEQQSDEWVAVINFADDKALQHWLTSPERAQWVEKLRAQLGEFQLKKMLGGFGFWFAGLTRDPRGVPPGWKMVLAVLVGLYPLVLLQTLDRPFLGALGTSARLLLDCAISVSLLQWVVMPLVRTVLGTWLRANQHNDRIRSLAGFGAILVYLAALLFVYRLVVGN